MGVRSKRIDPEKVAIEQLKQMLGAVSSRVFHCARLHEEVKAAGAGDHLFLFRNEALNSVTYLKETLTDPDLVESTGRPVGTKIYFSYNPHSAADGGRSIYIASPELAPALQFYTGVDTSDASEDFHRDLSILDILDTLPSLDPFLVKDRLNLAGIEADPGYFQITDKEFDNVREFVIAQYTAMVEFAFGDLDKTIARRHLATLVTKLWQARDMDGLAPLTKAMQLDIKDGPAVFEAWKGVIYYDYLFSRMQPRWTEYANCTTHQAHPSDTVPKSAIEVCTEEASRVRGLVKQRWTSVRNILDAYQNAYDTLFRDRKSPKPFVDFFKEVPDRFFVLGNTISRLDHTIGIWDEISGHRVVRRLKYEDLRPLFGLTPRLLE